MEAEANPADDIRGLSSDALVDELRALAAHIDAAKARWLALVAELDRRRTWFDWGARSCAEWVSWQCGISPGTAREQVRVATRLDDMPVVGEAFARGELSYSKVRALTRLDAIEESGEDAIVDLARTHTAAQLERVVRETRKVSRRDAADIHLDRYLDLVTREDGAVVVRGLLAGEEAAVLKRALDRADTFLRERAAAQDHDTEPAGATPSHAERRADALVLLADTTLARGPRTRSAPERHEVVVHVDALALRDDAVRGACATEDGVPLATDVARRLLCDAGIVPSLEQGGEPLAVGRRTRTIPPAIRRALRRRDRGCRFPGCCARRWVDAHHIRHWSDGGTTDLDNLVLLCHRHHKLLHEGGFRIERGEGGDTAPLVFVNAHGLRLDPCGPVPAGTAHGMVAANRARDRDPVAGAASALQTGQRLDLGLSVSAFLDNLGQDDGDADGGPAP